MTGLKQKSICSTIIKPAKMYSAEDDNTEVLYFEDATATFNSFGDELKVVKFGSRINKLVAFDRFDGDLNILMHQVSGQLRKPVALECLVSEFIVSPDT